MNAVEFNERMTFIMNEYKHNMEFLNSLIGKIDSWTVSQIKAKSFFFPLIYEISKQIGDSTWLLPAFITVSNADFPYNMGFDNRVYLLENWTDVYDMIQEENTLLKRVF